MLATPGLAHSIRSHVEAGALRVLATTGEKRWFAVPDAPTWRGEVSAPAARLCMAGLRTSAGLC
jgi:tripartite-type tricarboxylate transporter receptor subunit TctC